MAKDNKSLGKFQLTGIPPAPRGVPQIEVSFEIDANGILQVAALDRGTGRAQSIRISNTGGLSPSEVEKMRQDAELFADDDGRRRQIADLINRADNLFYSYEATVRENAALMDEAVRADLNDKATHLRQIMPTATHPQELLEAIEVLQSALFSVGSSLYRESEVDQDIDLRFPDLYPDSNSSQGGNAARLSQGQADVNVDLEPTMTADYEAID